MLHGCWRLESAKNMYVKDSLDSRLQLTKLFPTFDIEECNLFFLFPTLYSYSFITLKKCNLFFLFPALYSYSFITVTLYFGLHSVYVIKASSGKCSHSACLRVCLFVCVSVLEKENIFPLYERSELEGK